MGSQRVGHDSITNIYTQLWESLRSDRCVMNRIFLADSDTQRQKISRDTPCWSSKLLLFLLLKASRMVSSYHHHQQWETFGRLHSKYVHPLTIPAPNPGGCAPWELWETPLQACASLTPCTKSQGLSPREQANRTGSCRHLPQRSGTHPESISNIRMPSAHQSTARPWPLL